MGAQADQLLIARLHLTLEDGITPVDTGIRQPAKDTYRDPPLGGSDPTAEVAGVASRVQVIPQAPLSVWDASDIHHSEPYVDETTGTVWVDFWVELGTGPAEINVDVWDPHTMVGPMTCEPYNEFACLTPTATDGIGASTGTVAPATLGNFAAAGRILLAFVTVNFISNFDPANVITPVQAGWTTLRQANNDLGAGVGQQFAVFYRIAAAGDPASYSFTWTTTGTGRWQTVSAFVTGFDPDDPIMADAAPGSSIGAANPFVITAPSLDATPVPPSAMMVLFYVCNGTTSSTWTAAAGVTQILAYAQGSGIRALLARQLITAEGATGPKAAQFNANASGGFAYGVLFNTACGIFPDGTSP